MAQLSSIEGIVVYFTCWMDRKPVHLLSSFVTVLGKVIRKTVDARGVYLSVEFVRPELIAIYNHAMGGTDLHDQMNAYYETAARSVKWPFRIFTHFITADQCAYFV
jgi:hypothetical protein